MKFMIKHATEYEIEPSYKTRLREAQKRAFWVLISWPVLLSIALALIAIAVMVPCSAIFGEKLRPTLVSGLLSLPLAFIGITITVYWNLDSQYGRKWLYVSQRFNQLCDVKDRRDKNQQLANLWFDAIELKIWADPTIHGLIYNSIIRAINRLEKDEDDRKRIHKDIVAGNWDRKDVCDLLSRYVKAVNREIEEEGKTKESVVASVTDSPIDLSKVDFTEEEDG